VKGVDQESRVPARERGVVELPRHGRRATRKAEIRTRILQASRENFFRDGFMETSLDEVRSIWERPLRVLEQVLSAGVECGELRPCDPWVMAHVIWRAGNGAIEALVTPKRARVLDYSPEAIWRDTLGLVIAGMRKPPDDEGADSTG
jgi:hypothetical protein